MPAIRVSAQSPLEVRSAMNSRARRVSHTMGDGRELRTQIYSSSSRTISTEASLRRISGGIQCNPHEKQRQEATRSNCACQHDKHNKHAKWTLRGGSQFIDCVALSFFWSFGLLVFWSFGLFLSHLLLPIVSIWLRLPSVPTLRPSSPRSPRISWPMRRSTTSPPTPSSGLKR